MAYEFMPLILLEGSCRTEKIANAIYSGVFVYVCVLENVTKFWNELEDT